MTVTETQNSRVLRHLEAGKAITPLEALEKWGIFRLGARVWDLKQMGYRIRSQLVTNAHGKRFARYSLALG